MRISLILFAFVTVALCDFTFLPKQELTSLEDHRPLDDFRYFITALYGQFNLSDPNQIISCFDDKSSTRFFNSLYDFHQLLNDTKERNSLRVHLDWVKLLVIFKSLESTFECVYKTQDYQNLLNALEIDIKDPKILMQIEYIYYQARYSALLNDFVPVIKGLDKKNHKQAAVSYSKLLNNMVDTVNYRGLYWLSNQAFGNGLAIRLELPNPSDSIRCWDNESAAVYLEFLLKLSEVVSNGKWTESPINTHFFWRDYGKKIMERIPKEVFKCVENSRDTALIDDKLGIHIYHEEFLDLMLTYINNNRLQYWWLMKGLKENFDSYNLNHAGHIWGQFLQKIAKTGGNEDSDSDIEDLNI